MGLRARVKDVWAGEIYPTNYWGNVIVLNSIVAQRIVVKFLLTGNIKEVRKTDLLKGKLEDSKAREAGNQPIGFVGSRKGEGALNVGDIYKTNFWGDVEIIKYDGSKEVEVRFINTGNVMKCQKDNTVKGLLKDVEKAKRLSVESENFKIQQAELARLAREEEKKVSDAKKAADLLLHKAAVKEREAARQRGYEEYREAKRQLDSDGNHFMHTEHVDRLGYEFTVVGRDGVKGHWLVRYEISGNEYAYPESRVKSGLCFDRLSEACMEKEMARRKAHGIADYEANRERRIQQAVAYQKANPDKVRVRNRNRRARRIGAEGSHTVEEVDNLLVEQDSKCACCNQPLDDTKHLDHIMPLILGGSNYIENLQWLCQFCNNSKGGRHPDDWDAYRSTDAFWERRLSRLTNVPSDLIQIEQSTDLLALS